MKPRLVWLLLGGAVLIVACNDGGKTEPTHTPTTTPTATVVAATQTSVPSASACPVADPPFCEFVQAVDKALRRGDIDFIIANTRIQSLTCTDNDTYGPCPGLELGTILRGYYVGAAHTDGGIYYSGDQYRTLLAGVAYVDAEAHDTYGDGTWKLAAVFDYGSGGRILASTTIGPDPWYHDTTNKRRAFTWAASLRSGGWGLDNFLTYAAGLIEEPLNGVNFVGGSPIEGWVPWGGQ